MTHSPECSCTRCQWKRQGDNSPRVTWAVRVPPDLKEKLQAAAVIAGREKWQKELESLAQKYS